LAFILGVGWVCNKNGIMQSTILTLIGTIAGGIFGFTWAKKEEK
jgi:hypothetical protein